MARRAGERPGTERWTSCSGSLPTDTSLTQRFVPPRRPMGSWRRSSGWLPTTALLMRRHARRQRRALLHAPRRGSGGGGRRHHAASCSPPGRGRARSSPLRGALALLVPMDIALQPPRVTGGGIANVIHCSDDDGRAAGAPAGRLAGGSSDAHARRELARARRALHLLEAHGVREAPRGGTRRGVLRHARWAHRARDPAREFRG